jgi:uncharacterized protein YgiM (DUF1202 family)
MKLISISSSNKLLWKITVSAAVVLLIFTLLLIIKAQNINSTGFIGYIGSPNSTVYLRSQPDEFSRTIAILNPGTEVYVSHSTSRDGSTWYHIRTDNGAGWIPESNLSLTQP